MLIPMCSGTVDLRENDMQGDFVSFLQLSPENSHVISVSGVDDGVKIYDTSTWTCDTSGPSPLFSHHGHAAECSGAEVMVHGWQPGVGGTTVLSVDTQANLHAWQWKTTPVHP